MNILAILIDNRYYKKVSDASDIAHSTLRGATTPYINHYAQLKARLILLKYEKEFIG